MFSLVTIAGCTPHARPLVGLPAPARLPPTDILGPRRIVFKWRYRDEDFETNGEGVARLATTDSIRLDLFVAGGLASGYAILLGDTLFAPGADMVKRLLPPVPLLWAAVGRLKVPASADSTARADGDTLRVDIGTKPTWRAAFAGSRLTRLERIDGGRVQERVRRAPDDNVTYENLAGRRSLTFSVTHSDSAANFDATIWRH